MSGMLISKITSNIERFNMKYAIIFFLSFIGFNSFAGEHYTSVNRFDNTSIHMYRNTMAEFTRNGSKALITLSQYQARSETVMMILNATIPVECNKNYVRLKTSTGEIHRIDAEETELKTCFARIPVSYIRNSFTVELPMFRSSSLILEMDTSTLDLNRLK